jgi:hypothetical protein
LLTRFPLAGEYNGIDYLLLHNLHQLVFNRAALDTLYASP